MRHNLQRREASLLLAERYPDSSTTLFSAFHFENRGFWSRHGPWRGRAIGSFQTTRPTPNPQQGGESKPPPNDRRQLEQSANLTCSEPRGQAAPQALYS